MRGEGRMELAHDRRTRPGRRSGRRWRWRWRQGFYGLRAAQSGNPWHQATAATERIPHHLIHSDDHVAQGQLEALGGALDLLPLTAPAAAKAELEWAAAVFERATRSRITADRDSTRVLRRSVQAIWRNPTPAGDGSGPAMLLDAALIAVAFATHWHRKHQHAQQEAAAQQALVHLHTAYAQIAEPVLDSLARRAPGLQTKRRLAQDRAWDALTTVLAEAEASGHDAATVLDQALGQHTIPAQAIGCQQHLSRDSFQQPLERQRALNP